MSADDSFASLDLNSSQERAIGQTADDDDERNHVLGAPPDSYDDMDDPSSGHVSDTGSYASGTSEYNLDELPVAHYEVAGSSPVVPLEPAEPEENEPEELPPCFVQPNERRRNDIKTPRKKEKYADVFLQVFLSSALASCPRKLRDGFTPAEIDEALRQTMNITLTAAGYAIMNERGMENLPNNTNTEIAHALTARKWLTKDNKGKFFPMMSKDVEIRMAQTMVGADFCYRREVKKKQEAEEYKSADSEIRAMWAFNMIVDLMRALMDDNKQYELQYQTISTAFEKMVRKENYERIREKYDPYLNFSNTDKWNNEWYKANTNRSSLKKFVTMSKFSEIVASNSSTYKFRNHQSGVRQFTMEDMEQVKERFANSGNNRNRGNYGGGGGNRSNGPPRQFPSKKKEIVPEPNYQPVTMTGFDDPNDDGSLQPTSSSKPLKSFARRDSGGSRPGSPRRSQEGPSRRRSPSNDRRHNRSPSPPVNKFRGNDPFDSGCRKFGGDGFGGGGGTSGIRRGSDREGFEGRNMNRRIDDIGDTSSESDDTSDGEYSDDDESARNARIRQREEKKAKKEAKRKNRKPKADVHVDNSKNRFATSSFPANQLEAPAEPADTVRRARPSTSSRISPRQESPHVQSDGSREPTPLPTRPESSDIIPPREIPLVFSTSSHDYRGSNVPPSVPFTPVREQIMENARLEQLEKRREEEEEKAINNVSRTRIGTENTNRERENQRPNGTATEPMAHPGLAPRRPQQQPQQQVQAEFSEPGRRTGLRGQRMESRAGPIPPPQHNQGPSAPLSNQGPRNDNNSQFSQPAQHPQQARMQPQYHNEYQRTDRTHYDDPVQHRSQFQQQRPHDSNDRGRHPNQPDPYDTFHDPYQQPRRQPPVFPPPPPPHPQYPQDHYLDYRPPQSDPRQQYELRRYADQPRNPNWDHQGQQHYQQQSYPPQQHQQQPYQHSNPYQQPVYHQPQNAPPPSSRSQYNNMYNQNNNQGYQNQQFDNGTYYNPAPPPGRGFGESREVVSARSTFTPLNAAGRVVQNALHRQDQPDGPQLMHEAIKYEITNYLIRSQNRRQSVFESDLRQMVSTLGHREFNIVQFIERNMSVTVSMQYNPEVGQLQFFSRM